MHLALLLALLLSPPPYAWLPEMPEPLPATVPLESRFAPPAGFTRVDAAPGTYAAWLRALPVRTDRETVLAYDGTALSRPAAAIVLLDVGERDLQQCGDSAIRLHAEWLWDAGRGPNAAYHFTSGDLSTWREWQRGERFRIAGSKVQRHRGAGRANTHRAYREWLQHLFKYAGTQSLRLDSDPVASDAPLQAGDFFVQPGGPGHAVVILDVATDAGGAPVALIGQGFMPAEDFHVVQRGGDRVLDRVWFRLPDAEHPEIDTPSWQPFRRDQARRFRSPAPSR